MLIRLVQHYIKNPHHIDKLIVINNLPDEWIFREGPEGRELLAPWEADTEANIPAHIRHLCTPIEFTVRFPPIEKGRDWVIDKRTCLGLKFSFMTEPGRDLWAKIERYVDASLPRDQKFPAPVMVAKDQKSPFDLLPTQVPVVDLPKKEAVVPVKVVEQIAPTVKLETFPCADCGSVFEKSRALQMHRMKKHPVAKEQVGV